jgi:hypothetical protein
MLILIQIDSSGAWHVETDAKNGGTFDELYHAAGRPDLKKTYFLNSFSYEQSEYTVG